MISPLEQLRSFFNVLNIDRAISVIPTKPKEELSISYLNVLCAVRGIALDVRKHDDDGRDASLSKKIIIKNTGNEFYAQFDVQLKASSIGYTEHTNDYAYAIDVALFHKLRQRAVTKCYLFLLILPENESEWVIHSIDELVLKKCMYWLDLCEQPPCDNVSKVTLRIPKENIVTSEKLEDFLQQSANILI